MAGPFESVTRLAIEEIILGGLTNLEWEDEPLPEMPAHENVRGDQYYS